ncbi:MAG: DUF4149 domain-containing protein [Acidobacteria bacterium]|nr:DUF4149 domain-containing protein [Acidobacteriota bacterium]
MNFLRFLMLLTLAVWIGGLIFFPVVAGIAFSRLQVERAGVIVGDSLVALHWIGMLAGAAFLVISLLHDRVLDGRTRTGRLCHVLVLLMLALTAISQFSIIPRMDALRASGRELSALPAVSPTRLQFDSLHRASVRIESGVLLLGFAALYFTARRLRSA